MSTQQLDLLLEVACSPLLEVQRRRQAESSQAEKQKKQRVGPNSKYFFDYFDYFLFLKLLANKSSN